ncbi:MAG: DUF2470 domain-containing protein, partial [Pseudomonadota bacterium]
FAFWCLEIEGASFNGGFGKAHVMTQGDLVTPVDAGLDEMAPGAVEHMNEDHADAIALYVKVLLGRGHADWQLACLDLEGMDLIAGDDVARLWFDPPLGSAADLRPRLVDLAKHARELQSKST